MSNNIAEGFARGTTNETLTFLYISRGSSGEVRSLTHLIQRLAHFQTLPKETLSIRERATKIARQLHGWCNSLQNSDIKGQRYLTDKARKLAQAKKDREEFMKELEEIKNRGKKTS